MRERWRALYIVSFLLLIKQQFEMCVTDLSSVPPMQRRKNRTEIHVNSSPAGLQMVQNAILFGAAPPSSPPSFSVIYKNANYNANANTTE